MDTANLLVLSQARALQQRRCSLSILLGRRALHCEPGISWLMHGISLGS